MKPQYLLLSQTTSAIPSETNPNQLNPSSRIDSEKPNESSQSVVQQVGRQSEEMNSSSPDYFENLNASCYGQRKENVLDVYEDLHGFYLHFL